MSQTAVTSTIGCPRDAVWAVLADFGAISRWAPNVEHSSLTTEQADGVDAERRVQVGRNALLERITEWEPGRRLGYTISGLPPVVRSAGNTWTIEGEGEATTVTVTTNVDAGPRPPQQLVARMIGRAMTRASRELLAGLQNHLEENR